MRSFKNTYYRRYIDYHIISIPSFFLAPLSISSWLFLPSFLSYDDLTALHRKIVFQESLMSLFWKISIAIAFCTRTVGHMLLTALLRREAPGGISNDLETPFTGKERILIEHWRKLERRETWIKIRTMRRIDESSPDTTCYFVTLLYNKNCKI